MATIVSKRSAAFATGPRKRSKLNYDVAVLKKKMALRAPELKVMVVAREIAQLDNDALSQIVLTDAIIQGTGNGERIGERIKIMKIELTGNFMGSENADCLLVKCVSATAPQLADFSSAQGSQCNNAIARTIWRATRSTPGGPTNDSYTVSFGSSGLLVEYVDGTTATKRNPLNMCNINRSGNNSLLISWTARIWYYDC